MNRLTPEQAQRIRERANQMLSQPCRRPEPELGNLWRLMMLAEGRPRALTPPGKVLIRLEGRGFIATDASGNELRYELWQEQEGIE